MPTYQYQCKLCGYELEELQSMTEPPLLKCPQCKTDNLARVMGTGAGLIFKGTGFYLTDYKGKTPSKKHADEKKPGSSGEKGSGTPKE